MSSLSSYRQCLKQVSCCHHLVKQMRFPSVSLHQGMLCRMEVIAWLVTCLKSNLIAVCHGEQMLVIVKAEQSWLIDVCHVNWLTQHCHQSRSKCFLLLFSKQSGVQAHPGSICLIASFSNARAPIIHYASFSSSQLTSMNIQQKKNFAGDCFYWLKLWRTSVVNGFPIPSFATLFKLI